MAIYDGFFDAAINEETGEYDRAYSSGDFNQYFAQAIGSGVSICGNPDSCKVAFANGTAAVGVGYLFIQGYWLRILDEAYAIPVSGTSRIAVVAHLNTAKRMIEIETRSVASVYIDALCLAVVDPATGEVEDTRYNADVCGVISASSDLYDKVVYVQNYIDNEIDAKLDAAEAEIKAQEKKINAQIAVIQAQVDSISPPPVGSIKYSASKDIGSEWLRCDGSFINESDYPELVEALGKLTPSGDKFALISDGEIGTQISNGVLYGGRMWVYSYSAQKLYGVDVEGKSPLKTVNLTSEDEHFRDFLMPTNANPLALSIVPHPFSTGARLFLSQVIGEGTWYSTDEAYSFLDKFLMFSGDFTGEESEISMSVPFSTLKSKRYNNSSYRFFVRFGSAICVPYVVSVTQSGVERYYCAAGNSRYEGTSSDYGYVMLSWSDGETEADQIPSEGSSFDNQRIAIGGKSKKEAVGVYFPYSSTQQTSYEIRSLPSHTFATVQRADTNNLKLRATRLPLNIVGMNHLVFGFDQKSFPWVGITEPAAQTVLTGIRLPNAARVFVDAGAYLWGKDIYMIFVGTGIVFSRTLQAGDWGYLDTTSVLGVITQFGYLDYSEDEGTLYIVGQDTANRVKIAKIVLNTLYDYANDGAWLPLLESDGVPAYIKAKEAKE